MSKASKHGTKGQWIASGFLALGGPAVVKPWYEEGCRFSNTMSPAASFCARQSLACDINGVSGAHASFPFLPPWLLSVNLPITSLNSTALKQLSGEMGLCASLVPMEVEAHTEGTQSQEVSLIPCPLVLPLIRVL